MERGEVAQSDSESHDGIGPSGSSLESAGTLSRKYERITAIATAAGVVVAALAAAGSFWVSNATRRDVIIAQRATQFADATDQLSSDTADVQLGAIYSLESLIHGDSNSYRQRGCDMVRAFIDSRGVRGGSIDGPPEVSISVIGALNAAGRACAGAPGMIFSDLDLRGARLPAGTLNSVRLPDVNLEGAQMSGIQAVNAGFHKARMRGANLSASKLTEADFSGAQLDKAVLDSADVRNANFAGANLVDINLPDADARGAHFTPGVNLALANLWNADLRGAWFANANLSESRMGGVDLRNADLTNANLKGANLSHAQLDGAVLDGVVYDSTTIWPEGWDPPPGPRESRSSAL